MPPPLAPRAGAAAGCALFLDHYPVERAGNTPANTQRSRPVSSGEGMSAARKLFSVCIPAYNRARHLRTLLDSIFEQDFSDYEIVICEDKSREREPIASIVREYQSRYPDMLRYWENDTNLGYDANIRNLVEKASGKFCFFM